MNTDLQCEVRRLFVADRPAVYSLILDEARGSLNEKLISYLDDQTGTRLLCGAFLKNELVAVAALYFMPKLPWASLVYLKTNLSLNASQRVVALSTLVDFSFYEIEEKKCVRIFMANEMKKRGPFLNAKLYPLVKKIPRLQKYSFISEGFVKAGERPEYAYQWQLMGGELSKLDLGFVSATRMK